MNTNRKSINLFEDKNIRCYKTVFNITNEEDLLQWWEYNIENSIEKYKGSIEFIHSLYRACFKLIDQEKIKFDIIFEKSQEHAYWTIWAKLDLSFLNMNCNKFENIKCANDGERISFQMSTEIQESTNSTCRVFPIKTSAKELIVYDFLDDEDKETLIEINSDLNDELIYLGGKGFSEKSITKIQKLLSQYTLVLSPYKEIFHIKDSVEELSYFMNENRLVLIELDNSYISLFEGIIINLQKWFDALFVTGARSIEAYKDSINADVQIIKTMTMEVESEDEIEFF